MCTYFRKVPRHVTAKHVNMSNYRTLGVSKHTHEKGSRNIRARYPVTVSKTVFNVFCGIIDENVPRLSRFAKVMPLN